MGSTAARRFYILLLLTLSIPGRVQGLEALDTRLRQLPSLQGESAAAECGALLRGIQENKSFSSRRRAALLDRLRDTCTEKLALTDSRLVRISEQSVASRRPLEQEEPAALCQALRRLGFSDHYLGKIDEAHRLYQEAVTIARRWRGRGTTDEDVAAAFDSLTSTLLDLGKLSEASQAAQESLRLRRLAVPFLPEKVVAALANRARVEERVDLRATRATLREAHRLSQGLGPEHSSEASRVATNLGLILYRLGELAQAVNLLQEAEELRLRDLRTGRPARQLAAVQLLLGQVLFDLGDYPRAIEYYRKAVEGHRAWLGENPFRYGDALTGLATVLEESGRWDEALDLQRKALAIREAAARPAAGSSPEANAELQLMLARSLTGLGALQRRMGDSNALGSLERALALQDRSLGKTASTDRAETLIELAEHWQETGARERAGTLGARCLRELESLGDRGALLVRATELSALVAPDPAAGLRAIEQVGQQVQQLFGQDSPQVATVLRVRAELRRRQSDRTGALGDALLSQKLSLPHVRTIVQAFPRDQALAFAADRRQSLDLILDLVAGSPALSSLLLEQAWQTAARSRMLVLDAEIDRQRLLRATTDEQLESVAKRLASARERFAYLLVQTHGTVETQAGRLQEARRELFEAEAVLAAKTRSLLPASSANGASVEQLRRHLPGGTVLVAVFQYRSAAGDDAYLAFLLDGAAPARVVTLGKAVTIDWLVQEWRRAILSPGADGKTRMRTGQALRRAIWDPIARRLSGTRTVFLVPDGSFHLVPLIALPAQDGTYLIEQGWSFHTLTTERDLLRPSEPQRPGRWLALGGVDYERATAQLASSPGPSREVRRGGETALSLDPLRGGDCRRGGFLSFDPLPGSREEIQDLTALSKRLQGRPAGGSSALTVLAGREATEQALRQTIADRRIVHLATHGFAVARGCGQAQPAVRGIGGLSLGTGPGPSEPNPLSGLVLAGANERGKTLWSDQDGILTQEEILGLDLGAADWVVLSACETGLGKIRPGEGVVGMLRAFQVAGAKTIIVSLWSVRDQATRAWMKELYQARFERRVSTLEALRQAALHRLRFYRDKGEDNPADWAGFMATGQWK
jgi:CHAT domain-containing protein